MYQDTIAAISTPLGQGGIGIVRLSGAEARAIAERLLGRSLVAHRLVHGRISDPATGSPMDEVLASYMPAPHSYTKEDVVEINCHGGTLPLQKVLELTLNCGARLANPGEFTLRAFLNGRIDLAQAEAVLDVINAKTEAGLQLALSGLAGKLSAEIRAVREQLLNVLAYLTAKVDFPDDEVPDQDILPDLVRAQEDLSRLIASADAGLIYRQGVRTAIVGRPNVGKSSLLNRLLRTSRAIVTHIPGTTRDTLEEVANIKGVPFVLVDTAGITQSEDVVESLGIERSRRAIAEADFVLLVLDGSEPVGPADREIEANLDGKTVLAVINKADLPQGINPVEVRWPSVVVSALEGIGLESLEEAMVEAVLGGRAAASEELLVSNPRHRNALRRAREHLEAARASYEGYLPADFVSIDLTASLNALGEITGETVGEDLLDTIFSRFCIGK